MNSSALYSLKKWWDYECNKSEYVTSVNHYFPDKILMYYSYLLDDKGDMNNVISILSRILSNWSSSLRDKNIVAQKYEQM